MHYYVEPEVSGQLGEKSILDNSVHPPVVKKLHFIFYGWLGDDLIECFPVYLISEKLKNELLNSKFSGFEIEDCEIETSEEFHLLFKGMPLPNFFWLRIKGNSEDDFSIKENRLVVSDIALALLKKYQIKNAEIKKIGK